MPYVSAERLNDLCVGGGGMSAVQAPSAKASAGGDSVAGTLAE
jgi:hypothetical protein